MCCPHVEAELKSEPIPRGRATLELGLKSEACPRGCVIHGFTCQHWLCELSKCKTSQQITGAPVVGVGPWLAVAGFAYMHAESGPGSRLILQLAQWVQVCDYCSPSAYFGGSVPTDILLVVYEHSS